MAGWFRLIVAERFGRPPVTGVAAMADFVRTRASYVAQTVLYGYLKARMGTQFRRHFEDDAFSATIRIAAIRLFASCLSDLAVYAVAMVTRGTDLTDRERAALAHACYVQAFQAAMADVDASEVPEGAVDQFDARLLATDWVAASTGEVAFAGSVQDLLRYAPVIDEYKALDAEIVRNSIRFRWRDIREQFRNRVDCAAVVSDWHRVQGTGAG
jgi:hypothetical protein